jgi:hypothetical protein
MEKLRFDIADLNLPSDGSGRFELSVLLHETGFSYFIFDERLRLRALKSWQLEGQNGDFQARRVEMSRIVTSQNSLRGQFLRSTCTISNQWVSLVPDKVIEEKDLASYFNLLMKNPTDKYLFFSEKIPGMGIRLVWAAEKDLVFFCQNNFPGALLRHAASGLIDNWRQLASPHFSEVYVNVQGKMLQIGVFERGELLLFNSFHFSNSSDFLYFVLLAFEQFRLSPEKTPLFLCGELMPDSEIWRMLYRFIYNVSFLPRPDRYVFPNEALDLPGHLNFDLLAI